MLTDPVLPLKDDSNKHVIETAIVAAELATAEDFSSVEKTVPEFSHDTTPEAANDSVESGTTLNVEPQQEHEDDVTTGPETEDARPDIHSSLHNDPTPVPLPLEPKSSLIEKELIAECQVETTSLARTDGVPIDVEDQRDPSSNESVPNDQNEIEVSAKHDLTSTAEESVFASEPKPDDKNTVNQFEIIELRPTETKHMFSPVQDKIDVVDIKTSDSAPILAATEQLPEVASEEKFQPQYTAVLVAEGVLDNGENQVEGTISSTKLEGRGTAENIEAKDDVKEVD